MTLANPGHVKNAVTHGASKANLTLGIGGGAIFGVLAFYSLPVTGTAAAVAAGTATMTTTTAVIAVGGGVGTGIGWGQWAGAKIDSFSEDVVAGHLTSGFPTVFLGPGIYQAARAAWDTQADCAGNHVGWEGSKTVSLGCKPMSRVDDRLKCQGKIMEGLTTVVVGGDPVHEGDETPEEASNPYVWALGIASDLLGVASADDLPHKVVAGVGLALDWIGSSFGDDVGHGGLLGDAIHGGGGGK